MNSEICSSLDVVRKGLAKQKGFREDREVNGSQTIRYNANYKWLKFFLQTWRKWCKWLRAQMVSVTMGVGNLKSVKQGTRKGNKLESHERWVHEKGSMRWVNDKGSTKMGQQRVMTGQRKEATEEEPTEGGQHSEVNKEDPTKGGHQRGINEEKPTKGGQQRGINEEKPTKGGQ